MPTPPRKPLMRHLIIGAVVYVLGLVLALAVGPAIGVSNDGVSLTFGAWIAISGAMLVWAAILHCCFALAIWLRRRKRV